MATAGVRKAAVVLSSLPEEQAAALLGRMTAAEAAAVRGEMAALDRLGRRRREAVLREFAACATASQKQCRDCEPGTAGSKQWHTPEDTTGRRASAFQLLHGLETDDLLAVLADEHPQTVALVLSHLPARQAAEALGAMPPELQAPLVHRIATSDEPGEEIIRDVAEAIRHRLSGEEGGEEGGQARFALANADQAPCPPGITSLVKMLSAMWPADQRRLLGEVAEADGELLDGIRRAMFGPDVAGCETACG